MTEYDKWEAKAHGAELNAKRIQQAREAVLQHEEPDEQYAATDLICNLLHYMREVHGVDADDAIATARSHYDEELKEAS